MNQQVNGVTRRTYRVKGGEGVELHVEEVGNPSGRPVLFIHSLSQCGLAWQAQMQSDLVHDLRMVAVDLRGHGRSERPRDAYGDTDLWAEDIHEVITTLDLDRPVLCGWSYGGVVICDYLRAYSEHLIGGVSLVAAISSLGESVMPFLGEDFLATLPGLFSDEVETSISALEAFIRLTTEAEPTAEDFYRIVGYNAVVPPSVRQALLSRSVAHDDLLATLTTPVLITHGLKDRVVLPGMSERHARLIPNARASYYPDAGHTPFSEDPLRFNAELRAFATAL